MVPSKAFTKNVAEYEKWYETYPEVYESEILALKEHFRQLPENIRGIEVELGTGRFEKLLGIKEGIEPSMEMAEIAMKRGIEIIKGVGERLPYRDFHFDFVLYVTICHLDNVKNAFKEAHRVLKHNGSVIIGFLDREQSIAQEYTDRKNRSLFYADARFYTVERITALLEEVGFKNLVWSQTLFGELNEIDSIQQPIAGSGEGSFVVVRATKA